MRGPTTGILSSAHGSAWMVVTRGDVVGLGTAWRHCHGLPVGSETRQASPFSRVWMAALRLQTQPEEPVVASYGAAKRSL